MRGKVKAYYDLGIHSETVTPPTPLTPTAGIVRDLNARGDIDGILVQLPLPPQVDSKQVLLAVAPGRTWTVSSVQRRQPGGEPAGPKRAAAGIIELLKRYRIPMAIPARRGGGAERHRGASPWRCCCCTKMPP